MVKVYVEKKLEKKLWISIEKCANLGQSIFMVNNIIKCTHCKKRTRLAVPCLLGTSRLFFITLDNLL